MSFCFLGTRFSVPQDENERFRAYCAVDPSSKNAAKAYDLFLFSPLLGFSNLSLSTTQSLDFWTSQRIAQKRPCGRDSRSGSDPEGVFKRTIRQIGPFYLSRRDLRSRVDLAGAKAP